MLVHKNRSGSVGDELDVPLVLGLGEDHYEMQRKERKTMVRMASSGASWNDGEERPELCGRRRASGAEAPLDTAAQKFENEVTGMRKGTGRSGDQVLAEGAHRGGRNRRISATTRRRSDEQIGQPGARIGEGFWGQ